MTTKDEILETVRRSIPATKQPREEAYAAIARSYDQAGTMSLDDRIKLLEDRLHDYGTGVYHCSEHELPHCIADVLADRGKKAMFVSGSIPASFLPDSVRFRHDDGVSYDELDKSEGVLTDCAVAIAQSGTIILRHTKEEGRRALTLVPDYHLCLVKTGQIVELVVEGMRQTTQFSQTPVTTISGPSATADIEMTRIKGVHGPRFMDVIIVG